MAAMMKRAGALAALGLFAACAWGADSNDKLEYDRRSATRYLALFQSLDRNADGLVTRSEVHGDLNFGPRFDDLDIDRDDVVTAAELQRFIKQQYGVQQATRRQRS
jgi:hypothetical protein